jgi:hypothetical protein
VFDPSHRRHGAASARRSASRPPCRLRPDFGGGAG